MERVLLVLAAVLVLTLTVHSAAVQLTDSAQCELCKAGVSEMKIMVHDKDVVDLKLLGKKWICANVPIEDCDNWVTKWIAQVDSRADSLDPEEACSSISMCTASTALLHDNIPLDVSVNAEEESLACQACHDIVGETKKTAYDPPVISMAKHLLAPVMCDLAQVSRPVCEPLVNHFLAEGLFKTQNIDAEKMCISLSACQGSPGKNREDLFVEMADLILDALRVH